MWRGVAPAFPLCSLFADPLAQFTPRLEHGQHLHRLAQPHVVRQATAKAELAQKVHPAETFLLIGTQLAAEASGRVRGLNAGETPQLIARLRKERIALGLGVSGEQSI